MSLNLLSIFSNRESKRNELKRQSISCISSQFLGKTAREVGFIKRQFSLKIVKFFESLLCTIGTGGNTKIPSLILNIYKWLSKAIYDYLCSCVHCPFYFRMINIQYRYLSNYFII